MQTVYSYKALENRVVPYCPSQLQTPAAKTLKSTRRITLVLWLQSDVESHMGENTESLNVLRIMGNLQHPSPPGLGMFLKLY